MANILDGSAPIRQLRPVPADVPPAGGEAVPAIDVHAAGRTSQKLAFWAEPLAADTGISVAALEAYGNAELIAAESWPECHLRWNTLAGIGFVETRHGTYSGNLFGGSHLDENGVAVPSIIGVPLDAFLNFIGAGIQRVDINTVIIRADQLLPHIQRNIRHILLLSASKYPRHGLIPSVLFRFVILRQGYPRAGLRECHSAPLRLSVSK